ncbi:MAG TPA: hypothetical protein VG734_02040 [Lacunisphaera sp.]|nr:hypothetical protein [Lacunisphaera sp.]
MDENLQELENELKRLTPRGPSAGLMRALERDLGPAPVAAAPARYGSAKSWNSWKWASWSLAGIAAALALVVMVQSHRRAAKPPAPVTSYAAASTPIEQEATTPIAVNRYEPVQATSVLYDLKEDGPTTLPDQTEGRQVRYRYVDTYTWKNPATNASLRWRVPRDEVRLVRASLD